ncbi:cysteine proteinase inhibitor 10-like [Phaseolus vulgaris]
MRWALLLVLACVLCGIPYGELVGEKTVIADAKTNQEVQDLGRFAVDERNRKLKESGAMRPVVAFVTVLEAQKQVVSGTKYYLKISTNQNEARESVIYDSVVVVKGSSKELQIFTVSQ